MPFILDLLIPVVVVAALGALVWKGASNGDEPNDANATVSLYRHRGPEVSQLLARIHVTNRADRPIVVSVRSAPMSWLSYQTDFPVLRSTATLHPRDLKNREPLGAVEAGEEHTWTLPIADSGRRYLRVVVEVDQPERRTRLIASIHDTAKVAK